MIFNRKIRHYRNTITKFGHSENPQFYYAALADKWYLNGDLSSLEDYYFLEINVQVNAGPSFSTVFFIFFASRLEFYLNVNMNSTADSSYVI